MSNILTVSFGDDVTVRSSPLYQYDYGQILLFEDLELPDAYEVHFATTRFGTATTQIGGADGVDIPDALLQSASGIYAWTYLHTGADDGETVYTVYIPVIQRAQPSNGTPSSAQQDAITQAIAALNTAVAVSAQNAASAELSADEAELYAERAEQAADQAGWVHFHVDNTTGKAYATLTENLEEDMGFSIDQSSGKMEVTFYG